MKVTDETLDVTQAGSDYSTGTVEIDLSQKIPERRKDPVIEYRRFLTSALLEQWQRENPQYSIFSTEFHPCNEEGYDVAIYVTCGDLNAFNQHNSMIDVLLNLRQEALMAAAEADPDVITTPPDYVGKDLYSADAEVADTDMSKPDPSADISNPVDDEAPKKVPKKAPK